MLNNITLGQYYPGDTCIHRMDPRSKTLAVIALIVLIFVAQSFSAYAVLFAFAMWASLMSRVGMRTVWRSLKPILIIVICTFVLNVLFTDSGDTLMEWKFLHITAGGVSTAFRMAIRLILLVLCTQLLTLTTSPISLTDGMERLLQPAAKIGFPAHELAMMMSIALRFIPTLMEETDKIMKAQKSRGANFDSGNLLQRAKAMLPLLVPLFLSAFRRADELAQAMEARCYRGGSGRTRMKVLRFTRVDGYCAIALCVLCAAVILANRLI